jgi:hypothetical protein
MKRIFLSLLVLAAVTANAHSETLTPAPETAPVADDQALFEGYIETINRLRADFGVPGIPLPDASGSPEAGPTEEELIGKIKLRVISGNQGVPFPKPSDVVFEPTPTPEYAAALTETPEPTATPWQPPGKCAESKTIKVAVVPETKDNRIVNDKLFVSEDLLPMDEGEVYGTGVRLYPYGPKRGKGQLLLQEMYLIPCLPYRIRSTPWGQYEHSGNDALKNYPGDGASSGSFHPWVAQKLFPTPPRKR